VDGSQSPQTCTEKIELIRTGSEDSLLRQGRCLPALQLGHDSIAATGQWPCSFTGSNDLIRSQSLPTRRQRQFYRLLLDTAAPAHPALTGHGLGYNTGPRIRIVACRLLHHFVGKCAESGHWQVATGAECCCSCGLQYSQVRPRFVAAPALRTNSALYCTVADFCVQVSDVWARQHLPFATRRLLVVPLCRLSTLGPRAFSDSLAGTAWDVCWGRFYLHCTEAFSVLKMFQGQAYYACSLHMCSIMWPQRSLKTTRSNFMTPNFYSLYNFYRVTMTIRRRRL